MIIRAKSHGFDFLEIWQNSLKPILPTAITRVRLVATPISVAASLTSPGNNALIKKSKRGAIKITVKGVSNFFSENFSSYSTRPRTLRRKKKYPSATEKTKNDAR